MSTWLIKWPGLTEQFEIIRNKNDDDTLYTWVKHEEILKHEKTLEEILNEL